MGTITLASPFQPLTAGQQTSNLDQKWFGNALRPWKYSGLSFDFNCTATDTGNAVVPTLGTVPTDTVGLEMWVNGNAADDYLFMATGTGVLGATGVIASNVTANLAAVRWVASGNHIILPCTAVGTVPAIIRLATGKAAARCQGRFISAAAGFPYLLASSTQDTVTGAGASVQLAFATTSKYPAGYAAVILQLVGPGPARFYADGTVPSATSGDILIPGTYLIDFARHGLSITALRFFLPTGTNIIAHALNYA